MTEVLIWGPKALAVVIAALVGRGLVAHLGGGRDDATNRLAAGLLLVFLAFALRSGFVIARGVMGWIGGHSIAFNFAADLLFVWGVWNLLVLLWLLIPIEERGRWSVWTAPFYPKRWMFCVGARLRRRR